MYGLKAYQVAMKNGQCGLWVVWKRATHLAAVYVLCSSAPTWVSILNRVRSSDIVL